MNKHKMKRILLGVYLMIISSIFISCTAIYKNNINDITAKGDEELEGTIRFVSNRTDKKAELEALISDFEEMHPGGKS
ncbi:hypothetical protein [Clostridium disporicum]|uniref:Lipoprotein n=1 Tax=Clostridium disporicum TaxID=84024 RepID=A0A174C9W0_9CLOT|nr:hypothetical protein [Clostridium disporicum]CUO08528.1 Uncharacterised protein [Clostridium disporicum]